MTITPQPTLQTLRTPDCVTDQPQIPAPIYHQIPAELQARAQWVLWRYERKGDNWTKVPYQPNLSPAATNRPHTWSTFADAKAAYLARPDYFDGIGYVFSKNDPYCGADFDHCIGDDGQISSWAAAHIVALRAAGAYIEISVSGSGVHAITRATLGKGRKTSQGEIYDRGRFFTISGQALDPTPISDGQTAIDALRADLGSGKKDDTASSFTEGTAGDGDRAALAASHPADEWEQARQLLRTERDLLLRRSLAATKFEKTHKGDVNQGHYAARLLWPELHQRCPGIGLYRADGSLDDSQARCTLATALYGRGFSFPQYVVIMSHHFAAYCLAKWGTREMWREELAACWQYAIEHTAYQPKAPAPAAQPAVAIPAKPRGRASDHAAQVEHVYGLLLEHRAGAQAIVHTAELASTADMHRVTLAGILAELRSAGRITTKRNGRYGGLIVSFPDVAIVATAAPELCATTTETPIEAPSTIEETRVRRNTACVSSESHELGYSSQVQPPAAVAPALRSLVDAVRLAFDQVRVNHETGERQRITRKRLLLAVAECWPDPPPAAQLDQVIADERTRRRCADTVADMATMSPATLRAQIRLMERLGDKSREHRTNLYRFADWAARELRRELASRPAEPGRKPRKNCEALPDPRKVAERQQAELWQVADRGLALVRAERRGGGTAARVSPPTSAVAVATAVPDGWAMIRRLQQAAAQRHEAAPPHKLARSAPVAQQSGLDLDFRDCFGPSWAPTARSPTPIQG